MIEPLNVDAAPALQQLFERCDDFWQLIEGRFPPPDSGLKELTFTMPDRPTAVTMNFGVYEGDRLIAFAGLLREFPKPTEWFLGLMVVDPDHRGRGLGASLHREIVELIAAEGGTTLWIGVQTHNTSALRFWQRMGFVERERQIWTATSGLQWETILLSIPLNAAP